MTKILPVIMCGGSGTRVWPESRESLPKQFIPLVGARSTFQMATEMLDDAAFETPVVISNQEYRFLVAEQLAEIGRDARIVLEPVRRNSGPAVAVGAEIAAEAGPDTIVAVLAADHVVQDKAGFHRALQAGGGGGRAGLYRDARRQADGAGDRLRLYQDRQAGGARRGGAEGGGLRRKARRRHGGTLYRRELSLEFGQFLFPRRCDAGRIADLRPRHRGGGRRGGRESQARPQFRRARPRRLQPRAENLDRLRRHGAHRQGGGRAGRHRLVGRRQLGRGVGTVGPRRKWQFDARPWRRHERLERPCALATSI